MGSIIELNDTLQITAEQGFPADELNLQKHLKTPYTLEDVAGKVFTFQAKPKIRVYQQPPVRNFLVQNIDGKWVYWGQCFVLEITHDYENQTTGGTFKIVRLNTPEEMREAFKHLDRNTQNDYFA